MRGGTRHHEPHYGGVSVCVEGIAPAEGWIRRRRRMATGRRLAGKRRIELSLNDIHFLFQIPCLDSSSCHVFSCFSCLSLLISSLFRFFSFSSLFFPFPYTSEYMFFFSFLPFICSFSPIDLRLPCVYLVIDTTCDTYVVVFLGWQSE